MATQVQLRRGTAAENNSFTGAQGELTYDTTNKRIRVHDGGTAGGFEIKTEDGSGNTIFADNEKAIFGTGSDLEIYHDSGDSVIHDNGAGNLKIRATNLEINNAGNTQNIIRGLDGGAVDLYYAGNSKLATTSGGVDVTGTVTADGLTVDGQTSTTVATFDSTWARMYFGISGSAITYFDCDTFIFRNSPSSGATERLRIDSNGDVLVGTTDNTIYNNNTNSSADNGLNLRGDGKLDAARYNGPVLGLNLTGNDGTIVDFRKSGTTIGSIGANATYPYIANAVNVGLRFVGSDIRPANSTGADRDNAIDLGDAVSRFKDLYISGGVKNTAAGGTLTFFSDGATERMRIDGASFFIGKTSANLATTGIQATSSGQALSVTRDGGGAFNINRLTSDGEIAGFYKDTTQYGYIGIYAGKPFLATPAAENYTGLLIQAEAIVPCHNNGAAGGNPRADDIVDLGTASYRYDDVYATNGTIQTSDANEKQDIEELTDAEQRVAVAAKGLLRKYRWKSSVAEKGDEARIHFGIIAQDLKAAFEAEGLDAGRYAMFINSEWTDEETGEQRSRMGVRYNQLLAFIIAAI